MADTEIAIIGGGPAGLAAAIEAKKEGVEDVTVFERSKILGGLLPQCVHSGFGLDYFNEELTGPEYASRFVEEAKDLDIDFELDTMITNLQSNKVLTAWSSQNGIQEHKAEAVVLAMGCRERTRGALKIPGTRPAGVLTAGTSQRFLNIEGYLPGKEIVILGSGDIGLIMARHLKLEGAEVKGVFEIQETHGGLIRNKVNCLDTYDIPLFLNRTVTNIHGRDRVEGVTISQVDENLQPIEGTEEHFSCDTLLLSVGLIPENELSKEAGVTLTSTTDGPVLNSYMETNVSGIFAAGNVTTVWDLVDDVSKQAELAGRNAAKFVSGDLPEERKMVRTKAGRNVAFVFPSYIDAKQDEVNLYLRVEEEKRDVTLEINEDVASSFRRIVRPPEMERLTLKEEELRKVRSAEELTVNCLKS